MEYAHRLLKFFFFFFASPYNIHFKLCTDLDKIIFSIGIREKKIWHTHTQSDRRIMMEKPSLYSQEWPFVTPSVFSTNTSVSSGW